VDKGLQREICKDGQIKKFSFYGFLKNLKFFEPYLLIFLTGNDLSLLQIGFLFSIREIIVNVFEIPSGIIADYFGRKKELYMCFFFYIISFVVFFFSTTFAFAAIAMVFFGLGEAFRSGTHKAMIYSYLEEKGWETHKTFVYGKTRSASLTGSAISSALGILIIINVSHSGYIFLASTIPYIIDFFLVMSYPKSLDKSIATKNISLKEMLQLTKNNILKSKGLQHILMGNGVFEAVLNSIKDFIQPILNTLIVGTGIIVFTQLTPEDNLNVLLGLMYALLNIFSAFASRNAYRLKKYKSGSFCLNALHLAFAFTLALLGFNIAHPLVVCAFFVLIYLWQNLRKPIFVDEIDIYMNKTERATMLSLPFPRQRRDATGYPGVTGGSNITIIKMRSPLNTRQIIVTRKASCSTRTITR